MRGAITSHATFRARHRRAIRGIATYMAFVLTSAVLAAAGMDPYAVMSVVAAAASLHIASHRIPPRASTMRDAKPYAAVAVALALAWVSGEGLAVTWQLAHPADVAGQMSVGAWAVVYECVCAPIIEELTFRGLLLDDGCGLGAACVSTALFCLAHWSVAQMPLTLGLGMALCALRALCGRIGPGIAVHAALNASTLALAVAGLTSWCAAPGAWALSAIGCAGVALSAIIIRRCADGT